jgi:hypothetical protein
MSDPTTNPGPEGRRLNGWKEIAAYFGKSVRTVQRWEAEHRLPVKRLALGRAEVVSALVSDLERWRSGAEAEAAGAPLAVSAQVPSDGAAASAKPSRMMAAILLAAIVVVAAAGVALFPRMRTGAAREPATYAVLLDRFTVKDVGGRVLWAREFGSGLELNPDACGIVDLDGDGHQEVLVSPTTTQKRWGASKLYCFDSGGRLRWTHQYDKPQTYGDEVYEPPFRPRNVFFTDAPGGKKYTWVSSVHRIWFPTVLHKLDSTGAVLGEYWNDGYITSLQSATWNGRRVVLVGARNNEYQGASLALLDEARPTGSSPAASPRFQCRTCPEGTPLAFAVFRKPRRLDGLSVTAPVTAIDPDVNGAAVAWVDFAIDAAATAPVLFTLDRLLSPLRVDTDDRFESGCLQLSRIGSIAAFRPGEGLEELRTVLWWDGARLIERRVPAGSDPAGR